MQQLQPTVSDRQPEQRDPESRAARKTSDARRAYLRRYYQEHKEQAREYQRRYNLMHKKKSRPNGNGSGKIRDLVRAAYNASDIMRAPTEKSVRIIQLILNGERVFTM